MSDRQTSFHDFKWACGHTGPGYCKTCRDEQVVSARDALGLATERIDALENRLELYPVDQHGHKHKMLKLDIGDCDGIACRDETIHQLEAQIDALQQKVHLCAGYDKLQARAGQLESDLVEQEMQIAQLSDPNWVTYIDITKAWLEKYPPDIFTGESGDSGPVFVVAVRAAMADLETDTLNDRGSDQYANVESAGESALCAHTRTKTGRLYAICKECGHQTPPAERNQGVSVGDSEPHAWVNQGHCCRSHTDLMELMHLMIVCPQCGDKRCPKAEDCRRECTQSVPDSES